MQKAILDACCGGRHMWFNKQEPHTLYIDNRWVEPGEFKARPNFKVHPDKVMDFRELDIPDETFHLVVWDPPHIARPLSNKSWLKTKYGMLEPKRWGFDLNLGFVELMRVLKPYGVLVFKWSEAEIPLSDVLPLFPVQPLFGHTTGRNGTTKWLCFMKFPE